MTFECFMLLSRSEILFSITFLSFVFSLFINIPSCLHYTRSLYQQLILPPIKEQSGCSRRLFKSRGLFKITPELRVFWFVSFSLISPSDIIQKLFPWLISLSGSVNTYFVSGRLFCILFYVIKLRLFC